MALNTPKRIKTLKTLTNSPGSDCGVLWRDYVDGSVSPSSSCDSPEFAARNGAGSGGAFHMYGPDGRENRRGRPRSEALTSLMIEGSTSPSAIKCSYCNRVFPREKSLQAHLRTHTGERPYHCDYPGCTRAFTQSGQLKTHQRLHTGERPFMCSAPKCQMRFTHANRHCPEHPYDTLKRCDDFVIQAVTEQNHEVIKWLEKYKMEKEDRTPTRKTPKRTKHLCDTTNLNSIEKNENYNDGAGENECPVTPSNPYKSRKGLMVELDMNAGRGGSPLAGSRMKPTPKVIQWQEPLSQEEDSADESELPSRSTFNPKKRWLREAWQDDLARPLESIGNLPHMEQIKPNMQLGSTTIHPPALPLPIVSTIHHNHIDPNQMRPTVLMVVSKDKATPLLDVNKSVLTKPHETNQPIPTTSSADQTFDYNQLMPPFDNILPMVIQSPCSSATNSSTTSPTQSTDSLINGSQSTENDANNSLTDLIPALDESPQTVSATRNRKWMGALALMQLATDDNAMLSTIRQSDLPNDELNSSILQHSSYTEL